MKYINALLKSGFYDSIKAKKNIFTKVNDIKCEKFAPGPGKNHCKVGCNFPRVVKKHPSIICFPISWIFSMIFLTPRPFYAPVFFGYMISDIMILLLQWTMGYSIHGHI